MLEEVNTVESRQDVAMTLVKIYLGQGLVVPFLDYLNTREVNHTGRIKGTTSKLFEMLDHCLSKPLTSEAVLMRRDITLIMSACNNCDLHNRHTSLFVSICISQINLLRDASI